MRPYGENYLLTLIPRGPRSENRPNLFYFGESGDIEPCQQQCGMEPLCYAITNYDHTATGGFENQCYGVGYTTRIKVNHTNSVRSAIKIC